MSLLWRLLELICVLVSYSRWAKSDYVEFSGVYKPDLSHRAEDYTASFLISKERFLMSKKVVEAAIVKMGGEALTISVIRLPCQNCVSVMSRDYFDFMVEHLSPTTTALQQKTDNDPEPKHLVKRMKQIVQRLKRGPQKDEQELDRRQNQTVVIIGFNAQRRDTAQFKIKLQRHYLHATFWSIYRYTPHIVVYVDNAEDEKYLRNTSLPIAHIQRLHTDPAQKFALLKETMLSAIASLSSNVSQWWSTFKYVYYTEGDQILHLRHARSLFDTVDSGEGMVGLLPHRMQAFQSLPPMLSKSSDTPVSADEQSAAATKTRTVFVESGADGGSCCDNGRYLFAECGNWWYNCPHWGLSSIMHWVQFGAVGMSIPLVSEHQGTCVYSRQREVCRLPVGCKYRNLPRNLNFGAHNDGAKKSVREFVCDEMPLLQAVGGEN